MKRIRMIPILTTVALVLSSCTATTDKNASSRSRSANAIDITCESVATEPEKYIGKTVSLFGSWVASQSNITADKITSVTAWECRAKDGQLSGTRFLSDQGTWTPAAGKASGVKEVFHVVGLASDVRTLSFQNTDITALFLENVHLELASEVKPAP